MNYKKKFNYNLIPSGYYDYIYHKKSGLQSTWHNLKFLFVKKLISKKGRHLDVGCGPGTFVSILNKRSTGIDISKKQISYAKNMYKKKNLRFVFFKKKFPFKKNYFSTISIIEVIEHLNNNQIQTLIKESFRVLKKNGQIVLTTPNYNSFWPIIEYLINFLLKINYKEQHINKFNINKFLKILPKNKFKIIDKGNFMSFAPFFGILSFKLAKFFFRFDNHLKFIIPGNLLYVKAVAI